MDAGNALLFTLKNDKDRFYVVPLPVSFAGSKASEERHEQIKPFMENGDFVDLKLQRVRPILLRRRDLPFYIR